MVEVVPFRKTPAHDARAPRRAYFHPFFLRAFAAEPLSLLISINSLCWEINNAMNVTDEEDRSLRRCDGMCAAKPLRFEIGIIRAVRTAGG